MTRHSSAKHMGMPLEWSVTRVRIEGCRSNVPKLTESPEPIPADCTKQPLPASEGWTLARRIWFSTKCCVRRESNPRQPGLQPGALSTELLQSMSLLRTLMRNTKPKLPQQKASRRRNDTDQTLAYKQERSDSNTVHRIWRPSPLPGEHSCILVHVF